MAWFRVKRTVEYEATIEVEDDVIADYEASYGDEGAWHASNNAAMHMDLRDFAMHDDDEISDWVETGPPEVISTTPLKK